MNAHVKYESSIDTGSAIKAKIKVFEHTDARGRGCMTKALQTLKKDSSK